MKGNFALEQRTGHTKCGDECGRVYNKTISAELAKIYDPLRLASPTTLVPKLLY